MTGVSPAYFLSAFGPSFGPGDTSAGLPLLAELGFEAFQAEVFKEEALEAWTPLSTQAVRDKAAGLALECSAFVAHFMGSGFSTHDAIWATLEEDKARRALEIAATLCAGGVFAVPLPPLGDQDYKAIRDSRHDTALKGALLRKLNRLYAMTRSTGLRLALELMPGNALGTSRDFLSLCERSDLADLGIVFDTGHFWAMGEAPEKLPALLGRRIVATHLCDNDGIRNLSLCPGDGTIAFKETIEELKSCGYAGSLDLEIVCARENLAREYRKGIEAMSGLASAGTRLQGPTALSQP